MYARWWAGEVSRLRIRAPYYVREFRRAISARRSIMLNDAQEWLRDGWPAGAPQPYLIPMVAAEAEGGDPGAACEPRAWHEGAGRGCLHPLRLRGHV